MSGGRDGECPEWYLDILAAQRLGVSIVELEEVPYYWRERALHAISAENWAEKEHAALQRLKAREKGGGR